MLLKEYNLIRLERSESMSSMKELHAKKVETIFKEMGNTLYKIEDKETFDYLYTYYTEFLTTKDKNIN